MCMSAQLHHPTVCIIVPVYNGERYLAECLDSLLAQTYPWIKILVVNDESTDRSADITAEYASRDKRIELLNIAHGGPSHARNEGIRYSTEPYISFIDADDCLQPQAIEMLMHLISSTGAKIAACNFERGTEFTPRSYGSASSKLLSYEEAMIAALYQKIILNSAWAKIYHRSIFDCEHNFTEGILYEDLDSFYRFFERAGSVAYLPIPLYFYRTNPASLVHTWKPERLDVLNVTDRMVEYMQHYHPSLVKAAEDRRFSAHYNLLLLMMAYRVDNPEAIERCWSMVRAGRRRALTDSNVRLKNKLGAILSYTGKRFTTTVCAFSKNR